MSFAPRFLMRVRVVGKAVRRVIVVSKAARSARRSAGREEMVPRREMRRPAWSEFRRRVRRKWGIRDSTWVAMAGGVVEAIGDV
jgi:hypothetical protein